MRAATAFTISLTLVAASIGAMAASLVSISASQRQIAVELSGIRYQLALTNCDRLRREHLSCERAAR